MAAGNVKEGAGIAETAHVGEKALRRTIFTLTVAGLISTAISGTSHATLIAPLPAGVTNVNVTRVWWGDCRRDHSGRVHCRRCWYGAGSHASLHVILEPRKKGG